MSGSALVGAPLKSSLMPGVVSQKILCLKRGTENSTQENNTENSTHSEKQKTQPRKLNTKSQHI